MGTAISAGPVPHPHPQTRLPVISHPLCHLSFRASRRGQVPPASEGDSVLRAPHRATSVPAALPRPPSDVTWGRPGRACPCHCGWRGRQWARGSLGRAAGRTSGESCPAYRVDVTGVLAACHLGAGGSGAGGPLHQSVATRSGERPRAGLSERLCLLGVCQVGRAGRRGAVLELGDPQAMGHKDLAQWPCCSGARELTAPPTGPPWPTLKAGGRQEVFPGRQAYDLGRKQCALETSRSPPGPETDFLLTVRAVSLQKVGYPLQLAKWQGRACVALRPKTT